MYALHWGHLWWRRAGLLAAFILAVTLAGSLYGAVAQSKRAAALPEGDATKTLSRPASDRLPLVAIVSIRGQTIDVYDADGSVARSPISSGQPGFETPTGIFSIIQKNVEHYSNLYDDAPMPFMQRLTWSGVALHAGSLPGYPASHGCIRLPHAFAERLFSMTQMGTRVIVVDGVARPFEVSHVNLPAPVSVDPAVAAAPRIATVQVASAAGIPGPINRHPDETDGTTHQPPMVLGEQEQKDWPTGYYLDAARVAIAAQLGLATRSAAAAKAELRRVQIETASALREIRGAERALADAERRLVAAGDARADARTEREAIRAEEREIKAEADIEAARARIAAVAPQSADAAGRVAASDSAARRAEDDRTETLRRARELDRRARPISVFISRAAGRLYVRRGFEPIGETAIEIKDPSRPIGTHIFTAMAAGFAPATVSWQAVTVVAPRGAAAEVPRGKGKAAATAAPPNSAAALEALDRVVLSDDERREIAEHIRAGASIIISDERISSETGKGTDFVILAR